MNIEISYLQNDIKEVEIDVKNFLEKSKVKKLEDFKNVDILNT